jgi:hypothetical protein
MSVVPRNRRRGRPITNEWLMNFAVVNGQYDIPGLDRRQAQQNLTNYQRTGSFTTVTGWDGTSARVDTASRDSRLDGHVRDLYHQTDPDKAELILISQQMRRGSTGLAGGGCYFAISESDTYHKAHNRGVVLKCTVKLGNVKRLGPQGDSSVTFGGLLRDGYDSVRIERSGGTEYVVYNWDQVEDIRIA